MRLAVSFLAFVAVAAPLQARDSLGVFGQWGAFRDAEVPRCYAIAAAQSGASGTGGAFATVGTWPERQVRSQVHFRLSRSLQGTGNVVLRMGDKQFTLAGDANDAWAAGARMDAQILAAMRSASQMSISATDRQGHRFTDRYSLDGAATAMDAACIGCAQQG